ncbi:hypothetical protein CONCODRAFT_15207 [Conidiobolus coronatus NRRL 28638]|uniref:RNI-like protein n=1 Tax=Conidiobolus coronatus (strain ATCC 28846 / CBS 209.66 / NRRL 28638) TaxID=796925 RepID=A0A137PFZ6_CONC2|nr:hypothetical protein CONCODRAFT_15207 [Conidiobolus coronatus NRRL 28638]|eukprot:KXN73861.1 hypothetical protein CONCODRAFT_15207 [Conidiobolus coronatus NRRL 28638]
MNCYNGQSKTNKYRILLNNLKRDLKGKYQLVKEIVYNTGLSGYISKEFVLLFPYVNRIRVLLDFDSSFAILFKLLPKLNYLKHFSLVFLGQEFKTIDSINCKNFLFQLNMLNLEVPNIIAGSKSPFDLVDQSFYNLKRLTIINNSMLINLSKGLPSIRSVEFKANANLEKSQLLKFISNNSQLERLSIPISCFNVSIVDSIMSLCKLYRLELISNLESNSNNNIQIFTDNDSIKYLKYIEKEGYTYNLEIVKYCKSLEILEICNFQYAESHVLFNTFNLPEIPTLLISQTLDECTTRGILMSAKNFKEIKFRFGRKFSEIYNEINNLKNCDWVPKYGYEKDTDEFTLVKKLN